MSIAVPAQASSDNLRGIGAMLAAMAAFVVNDAMMKLAAADLPTGQVIFLRGAHHRSRAGRAHARQRHAGHAASCCAARNPVRGAWPRWRAAILYLSALFHMPIAECTAILQFTPLALTAGAALFLGARSDGGAGWPPWSG